MTLAGEGSRLAVRAAADRVLIIRPDGRRWTGADIEGRVAGLAQALAGHGLAGRRVGLWYWNAPSAIEAHLAVEWIGGTRVPVEPNAPAAEARAVFEAAGVKAIVTDVEHRDSAGTDALVHDDDAPLTASGTFEGVEESPERTHLLYPRLAVQGELMAVPISYANWAAAMAVNVSLYRTGYYGPPIAVDDRFLTAQQLMHGTGMLGSFPFLHMGLPQVILRQFDAAQVIDTVLRHRVTSTFFVPGMVTRLANAASAAEQQLTPPLRRILYGGAPVDSQALRSAFDIIGPVLVQLYGRFEGGWPLAVLGIEEHRAGPKADQLLGRSCGKPIPQTEIELRPAPNQPAGVGELCVRNGMVVREAANPDGWCALGDLGRIDDQGYLYLAGRLDGMINTGSYHVYPKEIEQAIASIPGVRDALVRGEPDPIWGQAVTAYVALLPDADRNLLQRLPEVLQQRLARYKIPKRWHLVPTLDDLPEPGSQP